LWFHASPGKKVQGTSSEKKLGVVVYAYHPSHGRRLKIGESLVQASLGKKQDPVSKTISVLKERQGWGAVGVFLSSKPSTT
jgi:hypothetical protein